MKTLCLFLGLLPLTFYYGNALDRGLAVPVRCCFRFARQRIPLGKIVDIKEVNGSCPIAGFILTTVRNTQFCYDKRNPWAMKVYMDRKCQGHI